MGAPNRLANPVGRILLVKSRHLGGVNQAMTPPLGIMYLASVLRREGHVVRLIDVGFSDRASGRFEEALKVFLPDIVGISAMTPEAEDMHRLAAGAKRWRPGSPVVAGGPHASAHPADILEDSNIDYLCFGEGERSFPALVQVLLSGAPVNGLRGVAYRKGAAIVRGEPAEWVEDLDSLPMPAWDLIDLTAYETKKSMSTVGLRRYMTIAASRGCPYHCTYCHSIFGKNFRARSPKNVLAEMQALALDWNVRDFEFVDDIPNWDLSRVKEIFHRAAKLPVPVSIHFPNGLRGDRLDEEFFALGKQAGLVSVSIAVESAVPRIQRLCKKNLKLDRVHRAIEQAVGKGIYTRAFFMIGFPTETREEMEATVRFALRSKLHEATFFIVTPFGGTEISQGVEQIGGTEAPPFKTMDYLGGAVNLSAVSAAELISIQRKAYLRFYLSPQRILRILMGAPRPGFLIRFALSMVRGLLLRRKPKLWGLPAVSPSQPGTSRALLLTHGKDGSADTAAMGHAPGKVLGKTPSPCPACGTVLVAQATALEGASEPAIRWTKSCASHGVFSRDLSMESDVFRFLDRTEASREKPFDLAFEESSRHVPYCRDIWLDVTLACNLDCNICFSAAGSTHGKAPNREEILDRLAPIPRHFQVTVTGGEPTLRSDLIEIISDISRMGFSVKLLTNGLKLQEADYVARLRDAGVQWVFLQYDGRRTGASIILRGRDLTDAKQKALINLEKAGIKVGLAIAMARSVNLEEAYEMVRFAFEHPNVLHVAFLPLASVGRYRVNRPDHVTTAFDILGSLESSTGGRVSKKDFFFFRKLGHWAYRLTGNRSFQQIRCFHYAYLTRTRDGIAPLNRLLSLRRFAADMGRLPAWASHLPELLNWNRQASVGSPYRLVSIEEFFDADWIDLGTANRCYKAYATDRGFVPMCIYNTYFRDDPDKSHFHGIPLPLSRERASHPDCRASAHPVPPGTSTAARHGCG